MSQEGNKIQKELVEMSGASPAEVRAAQKALTGFAVQQLQAFQARQATIVSAPAQLPQMSQVGLPAPGAGTSARAQAAAVRRKGGSPVVLRVIAAGVSENLQIADATLL